MSRRFAVRGSFDDCQRLVKQAFLDPVAARAARAVLGQQHQPRAAAAAGGVLRGDQPCDLAPATASRPRSSSRAAISATRPPACGRASVGLPIGEIVLAHNANRTVPDYLDDRRVAAAAERRRRSPRRWTSVIRATWSACARCSRTCADLRGAVSACSVTTMRSARASAPASSDTGRSGARTRPRPRRPASACRRQGAPSGPLGAGGHRPSGKIPRDRRAADRARRCRCPRRWRDCSRGRRSAPRSMPTWLRSRAAAAGEKLTWMS